MTSGGGGMAVAYSRHSQRFLGIVLAVTLTLLTFAAAGPGASADQIDDAIALLPPDERPLWSGLDVRNYRGHVPRDSGILLAAHPLDERRMIPGSGEAYRILYSTPDQHGNPALSTGAVYLPASPPPDGGFKLIAYGHGTVGLGDHCAPSARTEDPDTGAYLTGWLREGYALVITDYQGLGTPGVHPYLHGMTEASSIVNSVRALDQMALPVSREWALIGHSQGGHAALFTSRFAQQIDADVAARLLGTVALAPGVNVERLVRLAHPELPAGLPPGLIVYALLIMAGMRETYPDVPIGEYLTPRGRELLDLTLVRCTRPVRDAVTGLHPREILARPLAEIPGIEDLVAEYLAVPTDGYTAPVLVAQGLADLAVPAPLVLSFTAEMAARSQPVELVVHPAADHLSLLADSREEVAAFLARLF
ncbi:Putative exported lipase [Hoyosella subflava DQS3-9A1]|uniref:Putative exported lipase n=2 Tax=Hoyosella TaxID=697025 RepID=F6EHM3_HOYSD|nr:Putative exported lipase [Hoyosella subflava DQS3-9A1]